jgi:signal transduction histidine kinase
MLITLAGNIGLLQQTLLVGLIATSIAQVIAAFQSADNNKIYRNALIIGFASVNILTLLTVILAAYPVEIARAPIYLGRAVDLIAPLILLIIVAIRGRLIRDELDQVKSANMKMSLRLDFEKNLFKERQILFDMLTHELKNPLASISLAVSSLKKYFSETQAHEQRRLQNVEESVKSMDTIIERCSLMNQIDQKEITPRIEPVQLTTVLRFVIDGRMDSTRVSQSIDCNITVLADEYFFKIIISNLLDNALKYAPKDSLIEIKAGVMPALDGLEQAKLIITNKVGVLGSPDPQKIFKRFYRNPLAQSVSGSGLGLNLVRELSQIQNLKLTVDSNQERVSITLLLPLARLS